MEDTSERWVNVEKINEVFLRVRSGGDNAFEVESLIHEHFVFEVPGAKFNPKVKAGLWDGKISLYSRKDKTIYVGLLGPLVQFCDKMDITVHIADTVDLPEEVTQDDVASFIDSLEIHSNGESITAHTHQVDAVHHALDTSRCLLISPTGSGKSHIVYSLCRWHLLRSRRILVVVPTTALVEQFYSDFEDYSSVNGWSTEENCQKLYQGFTKDITKPILFTTWQSIFEQPFEWFQQFDVVIGDEAHKFKATSLKKIMEAMVSVKYRIGTTGTIDKTKINKLVLEGLFGPVQVVATTKELQDQKKLSKSRVVQLVLCYPPEDRKMLATMNTLTYWDEKSGTFKTRKVQAKYAEEIAWLLEDDRRNRIIKNLVLGAEGNILVLFNMIDHGKLIFNTLQKASKRPLYFIAGSVPTETREDIRKSLRSDSEAIVVASYGTTSTGINIPSIRNIILAHPTKSSIRLLQSIGRGLRLSEGKEICNIYDVVDDLSWKKVVNHTLKHAKERFTIYAQEEHKTKVVEIDV